MRFLGCLATNRVSTIVIAFIFVKNLVNRCHFLDSSVSSCHHRTIMKLPLFRSRTKAPVLDPSQEAHRTQKVETLKAGRLAGLALGFTASLIDRFGARLAGSEAARNVAQEIGSSYAPFCDNVGQSTVFFDTRAHRLPLEIAVYVYPLMGVLLLLGLPYLGLLIFCFFLWYAGSELYFYKPMKLPFKKKTEEGCNVHAILEPKDTVRHTVVFTSHHDSAPLFTYNSLDRFSYLRMVAFPVALFLLSGIVCLVQTLSELFDRVLMLPNRSSLGMMLLQLLLLASTPMVRKLRSFFSKEGSPGAGDNLVSVGMTVQLARYFHWKKSCNTPLDHTRLVFCSFDGEEIGLRGSKAWFSEHAPTLIDPIVLNFDSVYYPDRLTFLERDVNGTVPLSSRLARRCVHIARSMGYEAESESIPRLSGGTDAAMASRNGLEACTLTAVAWDDHSKPSVYHTKDDVVSAIDPKAVEMALSVGIRLVELVDAERLWDDAPEQSKEEEQEPNLAFSKLTHR